ncbi:hypothetical protein BDV59DRAFT_180136 [Aspergillus ambiguus]|uniref:GMC family oxidoreductase n=1 Tax=Aspergillus ambiguus TaxID=176160 RepID=UPI003CCD3D0F
MRKEPRRRHALSASKSFADVFLCIPTPWLGQDRVMWSPLMFCESQPHVFCWLLTMLRALTWDNAEPNTDNSTWNLASIQYGSSGVKASFDYIVVGGGTAGVTIAARLAEAKHSVALVEAGDFYEIKFPIMKIPVASAVGAGADPDTHTPVDWGFVAKDVPGVNHRDIHFARGKCLGGSSAINYMIYQRPNVGALQRWADLVDDPSYMFDRVLPFYKRTVRFTPPDESLRAENATAGYNADAFDEESGPVQVSYPNSASSFSTWMKLGLESIGLNETEEFSSGSILGFQFTPLTIQPPRETRSSSDSFLWNSWIPFLTLYKNTMVKRILFGPQNQAIGVEVQSIFMEYKLEAKREVILSAGAFQSPQILMVSGIGPKTTLEEYDIEVVVDRPGVGQNLCDHVFFGPTYQVALETHTRLATDWKYLLRQAFKYVTSHTGGFTNPGADYLAFEKLPASSRMNLSSQTESDLAWLTSDWPEIEYFSADVYLGNFSNPILSQPDDGKQYSSIAVVLAAPTSRGNVTIRSADTSNLPEINLNWLDTETDQEVAVAAFKRAREAFQSEAMRPVVIGDEFFPGNDYQTNEEILDVIRDMAMTLYHPACTCKMGVQDDPMAVVDNRGRVFGVSGLRVVDASVFPFLPPGHPQSTICM